MNFTTIFGIVTIIMAIGFVIALIMVLSAVLTKTVIYPETKKMFSEMIDVGIQKSLEFTKKMSQIEKEKYEDWDCKIGDK